MRISYSVLAIFFWFHPAFSATLEASSETRKIFMEWRKNWMGAATAVKMDEIEKLLHPQAVLVGSAAEEYWVGKSNFVNGIKKFMGQYQYLDLEPIQEQIFEKGSVVWASGIYQSTIKILATNKVHKLKNLRVSFILEKQSVQSKPGTIKEKLVLVHSHSSMAKSNPQ